MRKVHNERASFPTVTLRKMMFLALRQVRYLHAADQTGNVPWITCVLHLIKMVMEAMPAILPEGLAQTNHGNLAVVLYFATVCVFGVPNNLKKLSYSHQRKT